VGGLVTTRDGPPGRIWRPDQLPQNRESLIDEGEGVVDSSELTDQAFALLHQTRAVSRDRGPLGGGGADQAAGGLGERN